MSISKRNLYTASLAVSLIGVFLLLTENFGAWQDRSSFYGVVEGYVWIGSEKAFPWAQIGILALSGCLLFTAYTSFPTGLTYRTYVQARGSVNTRMGMATHYPSPDRDGLKPEGCCFSSPQQVRS